MTAPTETRPTRAAGPATVRDPGSWRDPGGFVYRRDGVLYRQIGAASIDDWNAFVASGLADRLISDGRLIGHDAAPLGDAATADARAVIRPEPIEFISYPYEWTFGELQDAALLTLDVQLEALAAGWTLKDASAYNVQFRDARPVIIDSLSFEPHEDGAPWVAYRQFCEHFLAPLALMARRDVRLVGAAAGDPDGVPLDLATGLLPWRTRLELRAAVAPPPARQRPASPRRRRGRRQGRQERPDRRAAAHRADRQPAQRPWPGCRWEPGGTEWSDYADNTSYNDRATAKERLVARVRRAGRPASGSGTSAPTPVATAGSPRRPAGGSSPGTSTRRPPSGTTAPSGTEGRGDILPLILDLANPSPGIGWAGTRAAIAARAGRPGRGPGAGPGPPPGDLAQRAAADAASTCSPRWRRGPSSSSCPRRTRWSAGSWRRARTSSRTTRSTGSGPRRGGALRDRGRAADRGQPARPLPAAPARDRREGSAAGRRLSGGSAGGR